MTYKDATDFLFEQLPMYQRIGKAAYKADLSTTHQLDSYFNHPHTHYKTIHVGGTNGKGSVSHMLAAILQESGNTVGLYTSPHLKDFRERIRVNGTPISEDDVVDFVQKHAQIMHDLSPSFFEMTVAMALDYFRTRKVDIAVIEVGMGGRLDSTNIIQPILSVITNIDLDHTQFLGHTKALIAAEKGGIIKTGTPVVIGETDAETFPVFKSIASARKAPIIQADQHLSIPYSTVSMDQKQVMQVYSDDKLVYENLKISLLGIYQRKNVVTTLAASHALQNQTLQINRQHIYAGLEHVQEATGLLGRWQIIGTNPLIICDTAHNLAGFKEIATQIRQTPYHHLHMVWGMLSDKDVKSVLNILPKEAQYYFTKAAIPRSLNEVELCREATRLGLHGEHFPNVAEAFQNAQKNAKYNDLIFIGGSTFVVSEIL